MKSVTVDTASAESIEDWMPLEPTVKPSDDPPLPEADFTQTQPTVVRLTGWDIQDVDDAAAGDEQ